jgi:hypothetical protein
VSCCCRLSSFSSSSNSLTIALLALPASTPSSVRSTFSQVSSLLQLTSPSLTGADTPSLMSTLGNQAHAELRRAESPAYTMTLLVELEEYVDTCLDDLVALFDRKIEASGKATIEMAETLQMLAMDVGASLLSPWIDRVLTRDVILVGELAFGRTFGLCAAGEDTEGFFPSTRLLPVFLVALR